MALTLRRAVLLLALLPWACRGAEPLAGPAPDDGSTVQLSGDSLSIGFMSSDTLSAVWLDAAGNLRPGSLRWVTRNPQVVKVSSMGVVSAVAPGRTWIIASDTRHADSIPVLSWVRFESIHAGTDVTCGLATVGRVLCWGWNAVGSLGNGTVIDARTPSLLEGNPQVARLALGAGSACAWGGSSGTLCWGYNGAGQLGDGTIMTRHAPVRRQDSIPLAQLKFDAGVTGCGSDAESRRYCWGWNGWGQLLNGSLANSRRPIPLDAGFPLVQVTMGGGHGCGLDSLGVAYCWGRNDRGQLGDGTNEPHLNPVPLLGAPPFVSIVGGMEHACGREASGTLWCWGDNRRSQLGTSAADFSNTPAPALGGMIFDTITTTAHHTCGLRAGHAHCWGDNTWGQLGSGQAGGTNPTPTPIEGSHLWRSISTGLNHSCGIDQDGIAWCWGGNLYGGLGDGTRVDRAAPVRVNFQP